MSAYDLKIEEPEENGCTFEENALIKSSFVSNATRLPCLSDDSGICFSDLNNEPGIHSARWAGKNKDFDLAMFKINKAIKKINNINIDNINTANLITKRNNTEKISEDFESTTSTCIFNID